MNKTMAILTVALIAAFSCKADIIAVSNLSAPTNGVEFVYDDGAERPQYIGNRFTTGNSGNYGITSVTLSMETHGVTTGNFELRLFSNGGLNQLGSELAVFSGPTQPAENTEVTYTLSEVFDTDANTSYWLIAMATGGESDYGWNYTESPESSAIGWTIDGAVSVNEDFSVDGAPFASSQMLRINVADQIPEPATLSLIALSGGALLVINRRFS